MRQVQHTDMVPGQRYEVKQHFRSGTTVTTEGILSWVRDEYAQFPDSPLLNLHPYVGMPAIAIYEYKS